MMLCVMQIENLLKDLYSSDHFDVSQMTTKTAELTAFGSAQ